MPLSLIHISPELADLMADFDVPKMEAMDAYIAIRGFDNAFESAGIPEERLNAYNAIYGKRVHMDVRIDHTNWVVLRWPTPAMAQQAGMSTAKFEDFYFDVCNLDYGVMSRAMDPLCDLLNLSLIHISCQRPWRAEPPRMYMRWKTATIP